MWSADTVQDHDRYAHADELGVVNKYFVTPKPAVAAQPPGESQHGRQVVADERRVVDKYFVR